MVSFSLTKQAKLIKTDDFSSVFNLRKRVAGSFLVMRYKPNLLNSPRLGLIVAKKTAKLAVSRNYMRRVLRELFRLNQYELPSQDLIIQVQKTFAKPDYILVKKEFDYLMRKLNKLTVANFAGFATDESQIKASYKDLSNKNLTSPELKTPNISDED